MNVVAMRPQPEAGTFEEFWQSYPHVARRQKALAKAKWEAIVSEAGLETKMSDRDSGGFTRIHLKASPAEIIAGVKAYDQRMQKPGTSWQYKDDGKFICGPAVFLNQGRWLDFA